MSEKDLTFEQAFERLEKITQEIERGEIGLEESINRYEQGMKLVTRCRKILGKAELRIQKLVPKSDAGLDSKNTLDSKGTLESRNTLESKDAPELTDP